MRKREQMPILSMYAPGQVACLMETPSYAWLHEHLWPDQENYYWGMIPGLDVRGFL